MQRWASVLKAKGIREVTGHVVADDSFFDRVYRHPSWGKYPAWNWYYATAGGLSINDNCVMVNVKPGGAPGSPAVVTLSPPAPVRVVNLCKTASKKHSIWFDRKAGSDELRVGGYVRHGKPGYSHEASVPDPTLNAATVFHGALAAEGIRVRRGVRLVRPGEQAVPPAAEPLCERRTSLAPVLRTMVRRSHNHYAEQVLKTIGAEASGRGTWPAGCERTADALADMGFQREDFRLDDGSGLSRKNEVTPALLAGVLNRMARRREAETFRSLLAAPGQDGTLELRLTESPYRESVRAKTGYLSGVGGLSGYATARSGVHVSFAILVNDSANPEGTYSMRETVDAICRAIVDLAE